MTFWTHISTSRLMGWKGRKFLPYKMQSIKLIDKVCLLRLGNGQGLFVYRCCKIWSFSFAVNLNLFKINDRNRTIDSY